MVTLLTVSLSLCVSLENKILIFIQPSVQCPNIRMYFFLNEFIRTKEYKLEIYLTIKINKTKQTNIQKETEAETDRRSSIDDDDRMRVK